MKSANMKLFLRKIIIIRYWWKNMFKVLTGEASKVYKKKKKGHRTIKNYGLISTTEEVSS